MKKIRMGVLGTANIAFRRFIPAIENLEEVEYVGVATRIPAKGEPFQNEFGGVVYEGYEKLLADESIDAVYIPLPPALHALWAEKALLAGKHVLLEKPFTTTQEDTQRLISLARKQNLTVFENYMFVYHPQMEEIFHIVDSQRLGEIRLIRSSFCFPFRSANDFRYDKDLGGGAILDCAGYPLKLASLFLGDSTQVTHSIIHKDTHFCVDIYGCATLTNESGVTAQISFGMDNTYICQLEVFGSKGRLTANRIFTAPNTLDIELQLEIDNTSSIIKVEKADQFLQSAKVFVKCVKNPELREQLEDSIMQQSVLVDQLRNRGKCFTC